MSGDIGPRGSRRRRPCPATACRKRDHPGRRRSVGAGRGVPARRAGQGTNARAAWASMRPPPSPPTRREERGRCPSESRCGTALLGSRGDSPRRWRTPWPPTGYSRDPRRRKDRRLCGVLIARCRRGRAPDVRLPNFICLPDGMSHGHSVGTGTAMRPATLRRYAREAGFEDIETLPIETDFWRFYLVV